MGGSVSGCCGGAQNARIAEKRPAASMEALGAGRRRDSEQCIVGGRVWTVGQVAHRQELIIAKARVWSKAPWWKLYFCLTTHQRSITSAAFVRVYQGNCMEDTVKQIRKVCGAA